MVKWLVAVALVLVCSELQAQSEQDTLRGTPLREVVIRAWQRNDIARLPEISGEWLVSGRKNESVPIAGANAHVALKTGRQLFAKVPGVFVYDMDGSGNQVNIVTRGLDPHRSWEFNVRQNGVLTNSDMYGYPASHYSAPMESYERVELIRGTASLQYGAQFGGMVNYVTRTPDSTRAFAYDGIHTVGSYGLLSTFHAVHGTHRRWSYYAYVYRRGSNGYRDNARSDADAQYLQVNYRATERLTIRAELGRSYYRHRMPGPLNDSMFAANPRMATRSRNWYSPDIYVPAITANWRLPGEALVKLTASGVFGLRNSVMFDAFANVPDTVNRLTGEFRNRQVDIDRFRSRTLELRYLQPHRVGPFDAKFATGATYFNNRMGRRQLGRGTAGADYDLSLTTPGFGRDMEFRTHNIALFAEEAISLTNSWTLTPGLRWENGRSDRDGIINAYPVDFPARRIRHNFLLKGLNTQYQINRENSFYAGISEAYRPVLFKDIIPGSLLERVADNLKNASGFNLEAGFRGKLGSLLQYDVNYFQVRYRNRMGVLALQDENGNPFLLRTNTGDSRTHGVESFLQARFRVSGYLYAGLFNSTSWMDARYTSGEVVASGNNRGIAGNRVEAVPRWMTRQGLDILYKAFSAQILYSYVSETFADALNTVEPPATGARGLVPAYGLWDINASLRTGNVFTVRTGVNNLFDKSYFTRRPTFYPGPGIWPSDGRNVYLTLEMRL